MCHFEVLAEALDFEFLLVDADFQRIDFTLQFFVCLHQRLHSLALRLGLVKILLEQFDFVLSFDKTLLICCQALTIILDLLAVLTQ